MGPLARRAPKAIAVTAAEQQEEAPTPSSPPSPKSTPMPSPREALDLVYRLKRLAAEEGL